VTSVDLQETGTETPEAQNRNVPVERKGSGGPLFPGNESEGFRSRWQAIQGQFVDEPRRAVSDADQLVSQVISRLSEIFARERERMEQEGPKGADVSTEDLRQTFRQYRAFFDRLLAV